MSFWKDSEGNKIELTNNFDKGGGDFSLIPAKTQVKAVIEEAKWESSQAGESFISLKWGIIDGTYKGRKVFQKIRIYNPDAKKRDKDMRMLGAIDTNAGGDLQKVDGEPTPIDLMRALCNKPMIILLQVWEIDGKSGNWVSAVAPLNKVVEPPASGADNDIAW